MVSALGPGGMLQDLLDPSASSGCPRSTASGAPGSSLTFLSYPYVYLHGPRRPATAPTRRWRRRRAASASRRCETFLRVNLPQLRPGDLRRRHPLALYVLSEFGAVSMLRYDTLTPLVYIQYTTSFDRSAAAVARPAADRARSLLRRCIDGLTRGQARYHTPRPGAPAAAAQARALELARVRVLLRSSLLGIGMPVARHPLLAVQGPRLAARSTGFLVRGGRSTRRAPPPSRRCWRSLASLPVALLSVRHPGVAEQRPREARLLRPGAAGHHDRPRPRVLRRANYLDALLPDDWRCWSSPTPSASCPRRWARRAARCCR